MSTSTVDLAYYVSVRSGSRSGLLLGPFTTHAAALAQVDAVRAESERVDQWAHFYEFGTASMPAHNARPGRLNARLGFTPAAR